MIGRSLRIGIWVSVALLVVGLILAAFEGTPAGSDLRLSDLPAQLIGPAKPISTSLGFLYSGLIVLALTPVMRVAATIVFFFRNKDWRFLSLSAAIFLVLVVELILALT